MKIIKVILCSIFLLSFESKAYDVALAKIGLRNQTPLCYELAQKIILNKNVVPVAQACGNHPTSARLHQVEFNSRLNYQSHVTTMQILNEFSNILDKTKYFLSETLHDSELCRQQFKKRCIGQRYIYRRGIEELVSTFRKLRSEIFLKANMCPNGEVGCSSLVISDPYLGDVNVTTNISDDDIVVLRTIVNLIDGQISAMERRLK